MRWMGPVAAATLASLLVFTASPAEATVIRHGVRGPMDPVAEDGAEDGRFWIGIVEGEGGRGFERLEVHARRLDATEDDNGDLPEYHVFLIDADETVTSDVGAMRLSPRGKALLRFDTRRDIPDDFDSLRDFGGGTIEVRLGDDAVLRGDIPEFIDVDDDTARGAAATVRDFERLSATAEDGDEEGVIGARYRNAPRGTDEQILVQCIKLDRRQEYEVVAIASDSTETRIGTFYAGGPFGIGTLFLSTRNGDEIPGGGVLELSGQDVEVRGSDGTAVLAGRFPILE